MKVHLVAPQTTAIDAGGVKTQITQTAKFLPGQNVEVYQYSPWETYQPGSIELAHLFIAGSHSLSIANTLHAYDIPFVVSPVMYSNHSPSFIRISRSLEQLSKRFVSGIHTDYSMIAEVCGKSLGILPNTNEEMELIAQSFDIDRDKFRVIPNGVEERFADADPALFMEQYRLENFILFVGNLGSARKNALNLIKAMRHIDRPLVMIGPVFDTAYGRTCKTLAESMDHVHLLGAMDHDAELLTSAYAACEVFALPSQYETPGIAAMEAALAGAKVVITPHGGPKEYFEQFARYPDPSDSESIAEKLQQALDADSTDELKQHIQSNFTWPVVAKETAEAYRYFLS